MKAVHQSAFVFLTLCLLASVLRADEKKAQTVKGWGEVMDPDGDYRVEEKDGKLTIALPGKYHDLWVGNGKVNAPRVLREVEGDFSAQVLVTGVVHPEKGTLIPNIASTAPFQAGGLIIWKDDQTMVRLERAGIVSRAKGEFATYSYLQAFADNKRHTERKKNKVINVATKIEEKDTWLRLVRKEGKIYAAFSQDGEKSWTDLPESGFAMDLPVKLKVGVAAIQTTTKDFTAEFKDFKITSLKSEATSK
jgi:regulation of enolase protein 1 (concanavalin A-like superfamily)